MASRCNWAAKAAIVAFASIGACGLSACSDGAPKGSATLEPGAFRASGETVEPAPVTPPVKTTTAEEAAAGFIDLTTLPGAPSTLTPGVAPTGDAVIIDQFIGQINGRAMMASEFFADGFGDRLRAMGKDEKYTKSANAWLNEAARLVHERLADKVRNGLLLDEVYSAMTPEIRQQGLRYAMEQLRGKLVSNNEGSTALADERLRQGTGKTIDEFLSDKRDLLLMNDLIETKVRARVNVSWQQVKNEWERRLLEAGKQKRVQFSVVEVSASKTEAIAAIQAKLEQGTPFAEICDSELNEFKMLDGRRYVQVPVKGELASTRVFSIAELNTPAQKMDPGQTNGPIPVASRESMCWIHFDQVITPDVKPLYDAQLDIIEDIRNARTADEGAKYFGRLMEKSSLTPLRQMEERLLAIAISRYAPRPAAGAPALHAPAASAPAPSPTRAPASAAASNQPSGKP